jgi:SAM-dependent methyltransferase
MREPTSAGDDAIDQWDMVHELPPARLVDRIDFLCESVRGRRVVHLGFADARCATFQADHDAWLHSTLGANASELVGLDIDHEGVEAARAAGYESYCVDCRDPEAVAALGLTPADVVVIGELIEHLDDPGSMLEAVKALVAPNGVIVVTTPNGHGLFNVCAAIAGRELNHPDHVALYSWYTLSNLLARHAWTTVDTTVYVPILKSGGHGPAQRALSLGARAVLGAERLAARFGRPYLADGLILTAVATDELE